MQARVAAVEERRVGRHRQQLGQDRAQPVAHRDRPVGPPDPHVHVQAEGVVAPGHVAQVVLQPAVVLGVDDALVLPPAPGMGARGRQQRVAVGGEPEQPRAGLALAREGVRQVLPPPGADLDLRRDQLPRHGVGQHVVGLRGLAQLLVAVIQLERVRVEDPELLLDPHREVLRGLEDLPRELHVEHGKGG